MSLFKREVHRVSVHAPQPSLGANVDIVWPIVPGVKYLICVEELSSTTVDFGSFSARLLDKELQELTGAFYEGQAQAGSTAVANLPALSAWLMSSQNIMKRRPGFKANLDFRVKTVGATPTHACRARDLWGESRLG